MQTVDEQLVARLDNYGIADYISKIEEEAKEGVLDALLQPGIYRAFVDEEGALVIEYND